MKMFLSIMMGLVVIGCAKGSDAPAGPTQAELTQPCEKDKLDGTYTDTSGNQFILESSSCTGFEATCYMSFKYYKPFGGKVIIDVINGYDDPACPKLGKTTCAFKSGTTTGAAPQMEYIMANCGTSGAVDHYWFKLPAN
jgi:hypothetical protein